MVDKTKKQKDSIKEEKQVFSYQISEDTTPIDLELVCSNEQARFVIFKSKSTGILYAVYSAKSPFSDSEYYTPKLIELGTSEEYYTTQEIEDEKIKEEEEKWKKKSPEEQEIWKRFNKPPRERARERKVRALLEKK